MRASEVRGGGRAWARGPCWVGRAFHSLLFSIDTEGRTSKRQAAGRSSGRHPDTLAQDATNIYKHFKNFDFWHTLGRL